MLEIQNDRDRERARLMEEKGLSFHEASLVLAGVREFKPAFPKEERPVSSKPAKSLYERAREFQAQRLS